MILYSFQVIKLILFGSLCQIYGIPTSWFVRVPEDQVQTPTETVTFLLHLVPMLGPRNSLMGKNFALHLLALWKSQRQLLLRRGTV